VITPYGHWPSSISAEQVAAGGRRLQQPQVHDGVVYWAEGRPEQQGRITVISATAGGEHREWVPSPHSVRSRINGYGGGAYAVDHAAARIYFVDAATQALFVCTRNGPPTRIGGSPGHAYGDLLLDPEHDRIICVRERMHGVTGDGPPETLIAMDSVDGNEIVLCQGHDFYGYPALSPDGALITFLTWDQPDMPWDETTLWLAELDDAGSVRSPTAVAGGDGESVVAPCFDAAGCLIFASDRADGDRERRWQLYRRDTAGHCQQLTDDAREHALPQWVPGMRVLAGPGGSDSGDDLLTASTADGTWRVDHLASGVLTPVALTGITHIEHLTGDGGTAALIGGGPSLPASLLRLDASGRSQTLACSSDLELDPSSISEPQAIDFICDGEQVHGFLYLPVNPDCEGPSETRPPLIVKCHGGPTAATQTTLELKVQYWTSRGFALLDLNYRGSTGYGRAYRERLYGAWGEVEVADAAAGVQYLITRDLVDPAACFISGSSAGGYTVLRALMYTDTFRAGACYYGVSDLEAICDDTTRFEARYGDRLIAPYPAERDRYRELSPIHHAEDLRRPVIFFQGGEDEVVPPDQTRRMVAALAEHGVTHEAHHYPDEGHGFRSADTIVDCLRKELAFYLKLMADDR
jgi:dipeptidyl aminopeptidase/acylaminoacyl peptidase